MQLSFTNVEHVFSLIWTRCNLGSLINHCKKTNHTKYIQCYMDNFMKLLGRIKLDHTVFHLNDPKQNHLSSKSLWASSSVLLSFPKLCPKQCLVIFSLEDSRFLRLNLPSLYSYLSIFSTKLVCAYKKYFF